MAYNFLLTFLGKYLQIDMKKPPFSVFNYLCQLWYSRCCDLC